MSAIGPKDLCLSFLTQKRMRILRSTQHLFDDFWNSVSYTDEVESEIQYFLDGRRNLGNLLELPDPPS